MPIFAVFSSITDAERYRNVTEQREQFHSEARPQNPKSVPYTYFHKCLTIFDLLAESSTRRYSGAPQRRK